MSTNGTNGTNDGGSTKPPAGASRPRRQEAAADRRHRARDSFGPGGAIGIPVERSDKFGETLRRLGVLLGREKPRLLGVLVFTVMSVTLVVIGPKLLG